MLHMPDEMFNTIGGIQRNRLTVDALIIVARLQSLAKKLGVLGCVSMLHGGHVDELDNYVLKNGKKIKSKPISEDELSKLGKKQYRWLNERNIKAFSMELI